MNSVRSVINDVKTPIWTNTYAKKKVKLAAQSERYKREYVAATCRRQYDHKKNPNHIAHKLVYNKSRTEKPQPAAPFLFKENELQETFVRHSLRNVITPCKE